MTIHRTDDWSNAQVAANNYLSELLNAIRDHDYNPSSHISYDPQDHHLVVDQAILDKHEDIQDLYEQYTAACRIRENAVDRIKQLEKLDIGFELWMCLRMRSIPLLWTM